jgi:hypothetical protein
MCVYVRKLTFVPGPNDRSQAIYCLEQVQSKIRPVGHGLILTRGWLVVLIVARLLDPIPTGDPFLNGFQAINCLATIIRSLRDNRAVIPVGHKPDTPRRDENTRVLTLTRMRGRGKARSTIPSALCQVAIL